MKKAYSVRGFHAFSERLRVSFHEGYKGGDAPGASPKERIEEDGEEREVGCWELSLGLPLWGLWGLCATSGTPTDGLRRVMLDHNSEQLEHVGEELLHVVRQDSLKDWEEGLLKKPDG